jgi:hypothetical protein
MPLSAPEIRIEFSKLWSDSIGYFFPALKQLVCVATPLVRSHEVAGRFRCIQKIGQLSRILERGVSGKKVRARKD